MLQYKYGFTVGEEVMCNNETDIIVGFIEQEDKENWKLGYRITLKNAGTQTLGSVKRKLVKFDSLYGNEGDILLPKILFYSDKKVHNNIECPKCEREMYDTDSNQFFESCPEQTMIACDCGFTTMRYVSDEKDWLQLTLDLQNRFSFVLDIWETIEVMHYDATVENIVDKIRSTNERAEKYFSRNIKPSPVKVTRLEVITSKGRQYVNMNVSDLELSYQDDGRTLKLFVK
jgi:hypothetical protein